MEINKLYIGDSMELSKTIPDNFIDLIVTSPPYADTVSYGKSVPIFKPENYPEWFLTLAHQAARFLKPTGSFILNINDKVIHKKRDIYVYELVCRIERETGLCLHDRYVWSRSNGIPSGSAPRRLDDKLEYIFHFVRKEKNKKGEYKKTPESFKAYIDRVREPYADISLKRMKTKRSFNKVVDEHGESHLLNVKQSSAHPLGKIPNTVMSFVGAGVIRNKSFKHPAAFHSDLPKWFIKWLTDEQDVVLDPFMGSGTTAAACQELNRRWLGFEINESYEKVIEERLKNE